MMADRDRIISTLERRMHKINQAAGQDNCTNMFLREWRVVQVRFESRVFIENWVPQGCGRFFFSNDGNPWRFPPL